MAMYYAEGGGDPYPYLPLPPGVEAGHSDGAEGVVDPYLYGYFPEGADYFYLPEAERPKPHIINCNGYHIEVTSGQRKYGGPPPDWDAPVPGEECEVYVGRLPRNMLEDALLPLFEKYGRIWEFRLMMVDFTGRNRGFAFVKFTTEESAKAAIAQLNDKPIGNYSNQRLRVEACAKKVRLYIASIPKAKTEEELYEEFAKRTTGLKEVIIYKPVGVGQTPIEDQDKNKVNKVQPVPSLTLLQPLCVQKNRGFCFLEYETHSDAFTAKKYLSKNVRKLWGCDLVIDWADPIKEPDPAVMAKVKVLYVRKLTARATEERLHALFSTYGIVERVKRLKDFAFVHFENRADAEKALKEQQGEEFCGSKLDIEWGKPPEDKRQLEEILRARERRMNEGYYSLPHTSYASHATGYWNYSGEGYDPTSTYYDPNYYFDTYHHEMEYMNGGAASVPYYSGSLDSPLGSPAAYYESSPHSSPEVYRRAPPLHAPPTAPASPSSARLHAHVYAYDSPPPHSPTPDKLRHYHRGDRERRQHRHSEREQEHGHDRVPRSSRTHKAGGHDRDLDRARKSEHEEGNWRRKSGSSRTPRDFAHGEPHSPSPSPPATPPYSASNPSSLIHWRRR